MAQGSSLRQANQQWLQSYHTLRISSQWTVLLDGGFRWRNGFAEPSQYVIRPAVGYNVHPAWQLRVGWAHLGFYSDQRLNRLEFRPYLELAGKQVVGDQTLKHRFRWEHRSFHPAGNVDWWLPEQRYSRLRYGITWLIPIHQWTAGEQTRQFILGLGDEFLINAGADRPRTVFDQNRIMISPTLKLSPQLSIALTYHGLLAPDKLPKTYVWNHIAWLQIRHKLRWNT